MVSNNLAPPQNQAIEVAIAALLRENAQNDWLVHTYWPENEPRVRRILADVLRHRPPVAGARLLDVGCFNGYISFLLNRLGYRVTATDAGASKDRDALFEREGIAFFFSNLNELEPFSEIGSGSFDVAVAGEVFEHILNHPVGFLRAIKRVLRPGGLLVLTTPNPSTAMNAARLLLGRSLLWGTREFTEMPKFDGREIITFEGIHYREYTTAELRWLVAGVGFQVGPIRYVGAGVTRKQSFVKRLLKASPLVQRLLSVRLLGCGQCLVARKPASESQGSNQTSEPV